MSYLLYRVPGLSSVDISVSHLSVVAVPRCWQSISDQVCLEMKLRAQDSEHFDVRDGWGFKLFLSNFFLGLQHLILNSLLGVPDLWSFSACIPPWTGSSAHHGGTIISTLAFVCLSSFASCRLHKYLHLSHTDLSLATSRFVQLSDGKFGATLPKRELVDGCPLVLVHVASFQRHLP